MSASAIPGRAERPLPRPFFINDPNSVWIVRAGKADLFLTRIENREPAGARRHVMRLDEGRLVFGLDIEAADPGAGLLLAPSPDGQIERLPRAAIQDVTRIETWIADLSAAIAEGIAPKNFLPLETAAETKVGKESRPLLSKEGLVWVQHLEGQSWLMGNHDLAPVNGAGYLPIVNPLWLDPEPFSRLRSLPTARVAAEDPQWNGLLDFHRLAVTALLLNWRRAEQDEAERLRRKEQTDQRTLSSSFQYLAAPLRDEKALPGADLRESADPLLMACQAIGAVSGLRFKPHPDSRRGIPQKDPIADIAKASSVRVRRVLLEGQWWKIDSGPLLALREEDKRPLALLPVSPRRYEIYDPVEGARTRVNATTAAALSAFAYVFYRPFPPKKLSARDLMVFGLHGCKSELSTIMLMGLAAGLLGMITPVLTGMLFDTVIPGAQRTQLLQLTIFLVASAISTALFQLTRGFAMLRLEGRMDAAIQAAVWDRLLSLPVPFFRDYSAGDLATRGLGIAQIRQVLTGSTLSSILSGVFSVSSFFLLFYYSWRLALLATGLILIAVLITVAAGSRQVSYQRQISKVRGRLSGMVFQFITAISKFRVSGTEGRAFSLWAAEFATQKHDAQRAREVSNNLAVFNAVFPVACSIAIFYMVAYLMRQPQSKPLTTGEFLAFNAAFGQFLTAALQLSASVVSVLGIVPLYERARPILEALPELDEAKSDPGELSGNIEISHLAFRYRSDSPLVLHDISMSIRSGEFVAVVGASGCGKSTMFRLLLGFEKSTSGAIYYDGQDLAGLDIQAVRRQLGVVLQNGRLLSGDIFTNIVGSAPLTVDDAWEAARMAGFEKDVRQMPMGMHTVIGEGGMGLSGGQRQRLLIARALVGKPRIILFDEATSACDNHTQAIISRSLEELKATRVVIAHRLSTVINADRIFVFNKGLVAQCGSYAELMRDENGLFAQLAKRQLT